MPGQHALSGEFDCNRTSNMASLSHWPLVFDSHRHFARNLNGHVPTNFESDWEGQEDVIPEGFQQHIHFALRC